MTKTKPFQPFFLRVCYKPLDFLVFGWLVFSTAGMLSSETDDSSSLPVAEKAEVSPGARKPSIHLTLPDFQDASTSPFAAIIVIVYLYHS